MTAGRPSQAEVNDLNARMFAFMRLALSQPDPGPCDADVAAGMAGMIAAQRTRVGMDVFGMSQQDATAAVLAWVEEQAALYASLTTEGTN